MRFLSREHAGCQLASLLRNAEVAVNLVLGLPRGGVIVAAQIARELRRTLDVLIVRKLGHPLQREFAVGALAEPDVAILDEESLRRNPIERECLDAVNAEETERLREYRVKFHLHEAPDLNGKIVLLVDDGLAAGATMEAALRGARARGSQKIIVAAPVASQFALERLAAIADEVKVELVAPNFEAVGQFYQNFDQTSDDEVIGLLR